MQVKNIKKIKTEQVYDIEVKDSQHYILKNGLVSHNSGLKYAANSIIFLSKSQLKEGTERIGSYIRCTMKKSRLTREMLKVITKLTHTHGLDRYYGLVDLAVEAKIFKKISSRIELPDGRKLFEKKIYEEAETVFTEDVLNQIDEYVQKTFLYGAQEEDEILDEILEETETISNAD